MKFVLFKTIYDFIFSIPVKLTKQYMHKTASMTFLFQSYGSTVVLFAGMYTFVAKINVSFL